MEAALSTRRRRRILLLVAAAGIGGYATYKVCKSPFVARKRRRVASLIESLVQMIEIVTMGIDSTSLVAGDLRNFLLSDEDDVPRSIKQGLKIAKCREFQDAVTTLASCVSRGMVKSIVDRNGSGGDEFSGSRRNWCQSDDKLDNFARARDRSKDGGTKFQGGVNSIECSSFRQDDRIPERLLQKLFSDPGKGFASVVLGSVARNTVLSILEGLHNQQSRSRSSEWELRGLAPDVVCPSQGLEHSLPFEVSATLLDVCSSSQGRTFIASCIQAFVGTAVTVYLEKTKDVNLYEEMVAGVTKPSHQAAVKELFSSVCSSAVETFVRTSHEVLSSSSSRVEVEDPSQDNLKDEVVEELVKTVDRVKGSIGAASESLAQQVTLEAFPECPQDPTSIVKQPRTYPNWVDGISRTLAVPSNRKLLIDVAGTITAEAIHSFFEVCLGVLSPYLRSNLHLTLRDLRRERDSQEYSITDAGNHDQESSAGGFSLSQLCKDMAATLCAVCKEVIGKTVVVLTVFVSVVMHIFSDVPVLMV